MTRLVGTLIAVGLLLAACGSTRPAGGDPGGHRLRELSRDPVFTQLPPGAQNASLDKTQAEYRKPGFGSGGWAGPAVVLSFTSAADPASVFLYYTQLATSNGWQPKAIGSLGVTDRWTKTYSDGAAATLFLAKLPRSEYRLSGGIAPK
jgi:hypothetical protein